MSAGVTLRKAATSSTVRTLGVGTGSGASPAGGPGSPGSRATSAFSRLAA